MGHLSHFYQNPFLLFAVFVLDEMGAPTAFLLNFLYIYMGFLFAQGNLSLLYVIPLNLVGGWVGVTIIYWIAWRGLQLPWWDSNGFNRLRDYFVRRKPQNPVVAVLAVIGVRMAPVPVGFVTVGLVAARFRYWTIAIGSVASTFLSVLLHIGMGYAGGRISQQLPGRAPLLIRLAPSLIIWAAIALAIVLTRKRRNKGKSSVQEPKS